MQFHDAVGVVAGTFGNFAAAFEDHGEGEVKRVAHLGPDDVADEQRCASHYGEVTAIARHHVKQNQRQPPHRYSRPIRH